MYRWKDIRGGIVRISLNVGGAPPVMLQTGLVTFTVGELPVHAHKVGFSFCLLFPFYNRAGGGKRTFVGSEHAKNFPNKTNY